MNQKIQETEIEHALNDIKSEDSYVALYAHQMVYAYIVKLETEVDYLTAKYE